MHQDCASGLCFQKYRLRRIDGLGNPALEKSLRSVVQHPLLGAGNNLQTAVGGVRIIQIEEHRNRIGVGQGIVS